MVLLIGTGVFLGVFAVSSVIIATISRNSTKDEALKREYT